VLRFDDAAHDLLPAGDRIAVEGARRPECYRAVDAAMLRPDFGYELALGETYDCTSCGACCFGGRNYVQVFSHDAARLGAARTAELVAAPVAEVPASVGRASEPVRFLKMTGGRCNALKSTGPNHFHCAVYEDRPTLCRALEPGSAPCLEARARRELLARAASRAR
jgi:Fe-S-cluster containining protein